MNHSWRPPPLPPIPGNNTNICPICSTSHFPYCPPPPPPPPPFIENPRFHYSQPQHNYYHQRPHFDLHHHPPFLNHQSSSNYYNNDARRPTWYGSNPRSDMIAYDGVEGNYNNHPRGGVASASYGYDGYDNGGIKRAKIEITDNSRAPRGSFMGAGEVTDKARVPIDNERILKLIHDHGNVSNGHERLGETCEVGVDMGFKRKRETSEFSSMSKGSLDYNRYSNQLSPTADAMQHHLQPNRSCQPPYNWSESKGYYGGPIEVGHGYGGQPPLPASPPPPLPTDPLRNHFFEQIASPPTNKPSLFPFAVGSSADSAVHGNQSSTQVYHRNNSGHRGSILSSAEDFHSLQPSSEKHVRDIQPFPLQNLSSDEPNIIDASRIFKRPHRASRPDHLVIILRGLPGSGKSYLAKLLRDIEVENGGEAPRIHSMDEYFMTEVEKAEESELSKGSLRGKRQVTKTVMEYCYEPEMEEAYRASMLKAFKKTLDEGVYSFIIVDDRNLRVADFAQFWATAKRSGYEVYLVEASYKDPAGCAARNVHNFTLNDIQKMAGQWEEAPSLYLKMDIKSLLHGDGFDESGIQEVDMDMEDEDAVDASQKSVIKSPQNDIKNQVDDFTPHDAGEVKDAKHPTEEVNHLSRSKWSTDLDASGYHETEGGKGKTSSLSGIIQAYSKDGKSVSWGDQGGNVGFSISATRKTNSRSLIIGPGSGYNLKSNPLSEEEYLKPARNSVELKNQNVFQERIRAERESFKAVFDKRRQRIGGFNVDDE